MLAVIIITSLTVEPLVTQPNPTQRGQEPVGSRGLGGLEFTAPLPLDRDSDTQDSRTVT